ncbi:hypothetical protein ASE01_08280 [Nocardioides sp. Root190]|uniref:hypothetical protein n=1 Tax=Nocardioides sp. Root190 TaxID=1736488 RepID=UPI0006F8F7C0|nr:hypothetical protein [Nocardioides sp. Root190]KRB78141.1 hypothetical protein ASE01_08280 [Nocardioides sp. Root190]
MPEQHDPIDDLSRFGAGLSNGSTGGDMALSAADVRRRGDQIRRRRTALVAGGAAFAVAAVAVPIFVVVGNGGTPKSDRDQVADDTPVLSADDLLRDADTEYAVGEKGSFATNDTYQGDGQATFHPCQQEKLSALGATDSFTRSYDYVIQLEPGDSAPPDAPGDGLVETIAEFEDDAAARAAYDTLAEWLVGCTTIPGADEVTVQPKARTVEVDGGDAVVYDLMWGPAPEEVDPFGDSAFINETGLVLTGDRIAVVAVTIIGQDYNFLPEYGTPVERMIPTAAERLAPGAKDEAEPEPEETVTSGTGDPVISDDFPLASGWPATAGDGTGLTGPDRALEPVVFDACDNPLPDFTHTDRLTAQWEDAEDYRTRQLTTYVSTDEAAIAVSEIRDLYAGCPTDAVREDGYTPRWEVRDTPLGEDSFAILGWDELDGAQTTFGETILVVRTGSSVLVVVQAGHSGNPQGREDQAIDEIATESADVVAALCEFTEDGC